MESIRIGSKGSEVKRLQELLRQHGFKEVEVDGEFGTKTNQAVIKFKKKKGLLDKKRNDSGQIEGIVDSKTWNALEKFSFRLYPGKIDTIAESVIRDLCEKGHIEVESDKMLEAQKDLVAIMVEYMRRDRQLRNDAKERMQLLSLPYGHFGKTLRTMAKERRHPLSDRLQVYLANQFINNFLNSPNIDEVFEEDRIMRKDIVSILDVFRVNEEDIRERAKALIKNINPNDLQYEVELQKKMVEVRRKEGLLKE